MKHITIALLVCLMVTACFYKDFYQTKQVKGANHYNDEVLLSFIQRTPLFDINIYASGLVDAMEQLNQHIDKDLGHPNELSYIIKLNISDTNDVNPFLFIHINDSLDSKEIIIKEDKSSIEHVLQKIAEQGGCRLEISNGILFHQLKSSMIDNENH